MVEIPTSAIVRNNSRYLRRQSLLNIWILGAIALIVSVGVLDIAGRRPGGVGVISILLSILPWTVLAFAIKWFKPEEPTQLTIDSRGIRLNRGARHWSYDWSEIANTKVIVAETTEEARAGATRLQIIRRGEFGSADGETYLIAPHQFGFTTSGLRELIKARSGCAS